MGGGELIGVIVMYFIAQWWSLVLQTSVLGTHQESNVTFQTHVQPYEDTNKQEALIRNVLNVSIEEY